MLDLIGCKMSHVFQTNRSAVCARNQPIRGQYRAARRGGTGYKFAVTPQLFPLLQSLDRENKSDHTTVQPLGFASYFVVS